MTKRIIIIAILLAVLLVGGNGCMNKKGQSINDAALEYMEQKYDTEFEYVGPWGFGYTTPGVRQILVSCDSLPDKEILVVIKDEGKDESYSDNYMDYLYESQTTDYISQIAGDYFSDSTVVISIGKFPTAEGVLPTTNFEDYLLNKNNYVNARISIDASDEKIVREFLSKLKQLGVHFSFSITISSSNEGFIAQYFDDSDDIILERRRRSERKSD